MICIYIFVYCRENFSLWWKIYGGIFSIELHEYLLVNVLLQVATYKLIITHQESACEAIFDMSSSKSWVSTDPT